MTELLGTLLADRYGLERVLGQGGMGVVYQATDATLERQVAVKVLSKAEPGSEGRARLLAEAPVASLLFLNSEPAAKSLLFIKEVFHPQSQQVRNP